ncbi:protocadherin-1-like isoform X3 [Leucoraja erinacea]|uniref:protocadherin-1-like isoform X3 n=1 Tax=Leucoraja erinaceus TaxID=7782 RepID=UPI002458B57F|nr:protocadherin-1-like isoform X3 [Leucoraja erinacea]
MCKWNAFGSAWNSLSPRSNKLHCRIDLAPHLLTPMARVPASAYRGLLLFLPFLALRPLPGSLAQNSVTFSLPEEQPPNTLIGNPGESLGLERDNRLFKLELGQPYLRVDQTGGNMYTTETSIDREKMMCDSPTECPLEFEISVTDTMYNSPTVLVEGRILVQDVNDNSPSFSSPVISIAIPEHTPPGTLVNIPTASDRDAGTNGVSGYELLGNEGQGLFSLQVAEEHGERLPQLIVTGSLDREQRDTYDLTVRVVDGGLPPRSSTSVLRVSVLDINDNAPRFERYIYQGSVEENSPAGTSILQVRATDMDLGENSRIEYTFAQAADSARRLLRLDKNTGWITVQGPVDREQFSQFRFYVHARDKGPIPKQDRASVVITVRDTNDNAPAIEIRGIGLVTHRNGVADIDEEAPVDSPVALVQVSDRDEGENAAVTCIVAGDVPFQLKPASESSSERKKKFFLQTTTALDYEKVQEYLIQIVAVDAGNPPLSSTNTLTVKVTDANDNSPIFAQNHMQVGILENNRPPTTLLRVAATDADSGSNAELIYSLQPDPAIQGLFQINPNTGEVRVVSTLDREQKERYEFKVAAADKGIPSQKGTATVVVNVLDENDNDPRFMLNAYNFSVRENLPPSSPVGMVTVSDADQDTNARITLLVDPDNGEFEIQNGTGTILSRVSFDRERQSTYTFQLKAIDGGTPPKSAYVSVTINVLDENDNTPFITQPSNSSFQHINPLTAIGTVVERVKAEDMDIGSNANLTYDIVGGNPFGLFHISHAGSLTLEKELMRRHYGLHRLVVQVRDGGTPARFATALVHMYVNDTMANVSLVEALVGHSLNTPLDVDIAGDPAYEKSKQRSNVLFGVIAGIIAVILVIVVVVLIRYCRQKEAKSGYQAGKKETKDLYTPKQTNKNTKHKDKKNKLPKPSKPLEAEESGAQRGLQFNLINESSTDSPRIHLPLNCNPGSPDLGRHYRSNSPLPSIQLHPQSPTAGKKHQVVQDLPATNTFVGTGDNNSTGSDQYSDYSYKTNPPKYNKQLPHRRVTFSTANHSQDLQDPSQHSYYDSGLEESETPSSKSSSGPRLGPLALPEDHYERTTPDGSIGEMEHPENDLRPLPDVAMTGNCTRECTEFGHSDSCWMPGEPSPNRKPINVPKLSTFVPYEDHGSQDRLTNGSPRLPEDHGTKMANIRFIPTHSAFPSSNHEPSKDSALEEIPLTQPPDYQQPPGPAPHCSKREIYL